MRRCKTAPPRCRQPGKPCCADCQDKTCQDRCWNDPKRCGCWDEGPLPKKRERETRLDRAEIYRLHGQGLLQREIAARLGCSNSSVSAVLRERKEGSHAES